ncbi:ankyrin repeat domain-containing protein [Tabrizicola sp.]|uniref:ankyrin repeat domain-containing protein n=1 Tax=Tabrizicola sp. TaxID=2005166 RepID=UPI003F3C169D
MANKLPAQPNLDWLKKTAKDRLAEIRSHDPAARLHHAQSEIAKNYGFKNWPALKAYVDSISVEGQIVGAAVRGDTSALARLLSEHPTKVKSIVGGQWNRPLLHLASEGGHLDCIRLLLARGAEVHQRDRLDRATALHWAATEGHVEAVKLLAEAGGDINADDEHELGVIGWATCFRTVHRDVAELLLKRGAKPTIFSSIALGRGDLLRSLVGGDPRLLTTRMSRFEHRRTPLHFAVWKNKPEMVELLLQLGANHANKDDRGNTPLNDASARTDKRIVDLLVAAGANPKEQGLNRFEGVTPILSVKSVPTSIAYYVEKLGFIKEWDWGSPPTFGCVQRDQVRIFFCEGAQGAAGTWLSIFVHDVDDLYGDYQRRGAIVRQPPTNFPWGVREMNVEDPDGHRLRIGSDVTGPADGTLLDEAS